ncbi:MAG: hypothetical protein OXU66_13845 [Gammaproteobacteria bacterium]|nr:hypothetical protein [Gammaproteobacteria bacterium]MDD9895627.1 hypothetical protein [Gammaproteobacteria bacterium]MDD9959999.1 hypothetical protein [Gammaproteobacteria bacterium]
MDSAYELLMANQAQQALMNPAWSDKSEFSSSNIVEMVFDPTLFRPLIANWVEVASHLLLRLKKQVLAYGKSEQSALFNKLLAKSPPKHWQQPAESIEDGTMLTVDFKVGDLTLSMFTTISQFVSALDLGMEELLIESYFPANEDSQKFFANILN